MSMIFKVVVFFVLVGNFTPGVVHAQQASVVCTETVAAMLRNSSARLNDGTAARSRDASSMGWSSADGHRGVCRVDAQGRVYAVEVTQFPTLSQATYSLDCSSQNYRRKECPLRGTGSAVLQRQLSKSRCTQGQTWGVNGTTLWVDNGCSGRFTITPEVNWDTYTMNCESLQNRRADCRLKGMAEVRLVRQLSSASCRRGTGWDHQGDRLWADRGCRATFEVSPVAINAPGFADESEAARQSCSRVTSNLGFKVLQTQVIQQNNRVVDVELVTERNRIKVELNCQYDIVRKRAQLYDG